MQMIGNSVYDQHVRDWDERMIYCWRYGITTAGIMEWRIWRPENEIEYVVEIINPVWGMVKF